jgi:hypothetical protein
MPSELRYRGQLLGHWPTEAGARAHVQSHMSKHQDPESIVVSPARPLALLCYGSLVDTFHDEPSAEATRDALLEQAAKSRHKLVRRMTTAHFEVVSTSTLTGS